ncbi:hypothetical protein AB1Y20_022407 [Prymnesium parvum]|uniref:Phosphatidic acid phosphatase type 2/haloperoxidase domain-containing protein n=1 Tax=Prymnesium parvum TaxID=97485 RepID=A0AB34JJF3_PRYPA
MRDEGPVSRLLHAALAVGTAYLVVTDPFRLGAGTALTFVFTQSCIKTMKSLIANVATACGNDGHDAFWRRPAACGRESPGFPSAHTANVGALSLFVVRVIGVQQWYALLPMLLMAAGRLSDQNHTFLQTLAGCVCGPLLGVTAHKLALLMGIFDTPSPVWWPPLAVVTLVVVPVAYLVAQVTKFRK